MPQNRPAQEIQAGLTAVVAGIIAHLPDGRIPASSGTWHRAFLELRDRYSEELPELGELEFARSPGVPPVSDRLEQIFEVLDMSGTATTLNPRFFVREFSLDQKEQLKARFRTNLRGRSVVLNRAASDLRKLLRHATPPS